MLLTLLMGGVLLVLARLGLRPAEESRAKAEGRDLLALPGLGRLLRWRHFSTLLIAPTLAIFTLIVLAGLWGEQNSSNPAVLLTWILWWPAVIFTFFLVGRIWCTACPFGYLGDVAQKIFSFKRKAPAILKNMWWRLALFLGLTWATTLWAWDRWPRSTAWLALALTLGAIALAIIYEKRVFCRYVCPVGGVFGLYSMTAPLRLAVKDKQICQTECKEKNCYKACAWFQFPGAMERNAECNLCLNCVPACPYDNLALRTQPFGADLARFQPHRKSLDEAATVAAVLGVSLLQTMVMLNAWQGWEPRLAAFLHIPSGPVLYTLIFLSLGLVMPVLLVALLLRMGSLGLPHRAGAFAALRTYAYAFLPLGLGLHAAHNFHHLFGEGGALWTGLKAALARYTGWDSLAPGSSIDAGAAVAPNALFFLQWLALLGGLYLAFRIATSLVQRHSAEKAMAFRMALPIFLFAVGYTILNVLILAAPMAHRH
jgi:polyferredoxin